MAPEHQRISSLHKSSSVTLITRQATWAPLCFLASDRWRSERLNCGCIFFDGTAALFSFLRMTQENKKKTNLFSCFSRFFQLLVPLLLSCLWETYSRRGRFLFLSTLLRLSNQWVICFIKMIIPQRAVTRSLREATRSVIFGHTCTRVFKAKHSLFLVCSIFVCSFNQLLK